MKLYILHWNKNLWAFLILKMKLYLKGYFTCSSKLGSEISGSKLEICYSELFKPKMETTLYYFKGVQDLSTPDISFSYLNIVKAALANKNNCSSALGYALPSLWFTCEYCDKKYNQPAQLMDHLETEHKLEPSYICRSCMRSCPINQLSGKRWRHNCLDK